MSKLQVKNNIINAIEILSKLSEDDKVIATEILRQNFRDDVDWYGLFCSLTNLAFANMFYDFSEKLSEDL